MGALAEAEARFDRAAGPYAMLPLRAGLALVFLAHGGGRLFGVGPLAASIGDLSGLLGGLGVPLPGVAAWTVTLVEVVGGLLLLAGLFTRLAAALLTIDMVAASVLVHAPRGFPIAQGGYEFTLVLALGALSLALAGPGAASLDARWRPGTTRTRDQRPARHAA